MLATFLIMFREGIEAALLIGIIGSYLKQAGRTDLMKPVWLGIMSAVTICFGLGIAINATTKDFPQRQQELFAGIIGLIAVGFLTWMVFWMKRAARSLKAEIQEKIAEAIAADVDNSLGSSLSNSAGGHNLPRKQRTWGFAIVGMAFFAVAREGLESVFFLLATFSQNTGIEAPIGAVLGLAASIAVGFGIYLGGVRLNLKQFFRWSGIFILFVAAGLMASSLRAFHEAGIWNFFQEVVFDLSGVLPARNNLLGVFLSGFFGYSDSPTVSQVFVYLVYLVPMIFLFLKPLGAAKASARS